MKKQHASTKKKSKSFIRTLQNHPLPAYIALRRRKVKVGPLKAVGDNDLDFFVCLPNAMTVEE